MGITYTMEDSSEAYKTFLNVFSNLYVFPKIKIKVNSKTRPSPWITRGILKSSKRKQKLFENFSKNRNFVNKENYKTCTRLFESISKNVKRTTVIIF